MLDKTANRKPSHVQSLLQRLATLEREEALLASPEHEEVFDTWPHAEATRLDHIVYRRATDLRDCFRLGLATACIAGGVAMLILVFAQSPDAHADAGSLVTPTQVDFIRLDGPIPAARQLWWRLPL